jgi:hypothetical protein
LMSFRYWCLFVVDHRWRMFGDTGWMNVQVSEYRWLLTGCYSMSERRAII